MARKARPVSSGERSFTSCSQTVATNTDSAQRKFDRKPLRVTMTKGWLRKVGRSTSGLSTRRSSHTNRASSRIAAARQPISAPGSDSIQDGPRSMASVTATIAALRVTTPR